MLMSSEKSFIADLWYVYDFTILRDVARCANVGVKNTVFNSSRYGPSVCLTLSKNKIKLITATGRISLVKC